MAWTFGQFDDVIREVAVMGPTKACAGSLLQEVTLLNGEKFLIDADMVFASREEAENHRRQL
ncbi:hypothetical protein LAZ40_17595 [Cereibacter sphaeroides]|uniref:hypothetical protein n=1 Tax=Cereibacter sphaeroides TaxID=1063 RepID=UPI001F4558B6|nr:hypothetical protein [Cereibacter sphaeroides]MCE6951518.1 hypothetical protein [Cereibacter sphaeroides]MCE6960843.1 hypothetical protein [Cereibacter sphaeroides]MCE6969891.1 hypothetical protein [Cereibacter sphaeroides]MCE6974279.1 hypothetical protein [Cereibacter sphaeroides]